MGLWRSISRRGKLGASMERNEKGEGTLWGIELLGRSTRAKHMRLDSLDELSTAEEYVCRSHLYMALDCKYVKRITIYGSLDQTPVSITNASNHACRTLRHYTMPVQPVRSSAHTTPSSSERLPLLLILLLLLFSALFLTMSKPQRPFHLPHTSPDRLPRE